MLLLLVLVLLVLVLLLIFGHNVILVYRSSTRGPGFAYSGADLAAVSTTAAAAASAGGSRGGRRSRRHRCGSSCSPVTLALRPLERLHLYTTSNSSGSTASVDRVSELGRGDVEVL